MSKGSLLMPIRVLSTTLLVVVAFVANAHAGVVLSLAISTLTVEADPDGNATFDVEILAAADTGTQSLRGYDLFVDAGNDGVGLPAGWTLDLPVVSTEIGDFFYPSLSPSDGDVMASDANVTGPDFELTTTPTPLWHFQVDVAASDGAVDGTVDVVFMASAANFGLSDGNNTPITFSEADASIATITFQDFAAVPEPSAVFLVGLPLAVIAIVRSRTRHLRRG
jgi:hypothetical protein